MSSYQIYIRVKRSIDVAVSLSALLILSPLLIGVAILVRLRLGKPILFKQSRPGLNEEPFEMIKFRTMRDAVDSRGRPLPDKERLTPLGRFLRSTSIDELPGLWNVVKGDMSLVGPRPLLPEYLDYYKPDERIRHTVRPGLTGLAQVNGRNAISWEEKLAYDIEYVKTRNLLIDLSIIFQTIKKVIARDGFRVEATQGSLNSYRSSQTNGLHDKR